MLTRELAAHRSDTISVFKQQVDIDLTTAGDSDNPYFNVSTIISFATSEPEVIIDVAAAGDLKVALAGEPVAFSYDAQAEQLRVSGLPVNEKLDLEVAATMIFSHDGQGLHRTFDPTDDTVYLYTHFEPTAAHRAWPCFDQMDLKPRWLMRVLAPSKWTVIANQQEVASTSQSAEISWREFALTQPLSPYLTALAAGDFQLVAAATYTCAVAAVDVDEIPLAVYARTALADSLDGEFVLQVTRQCLDYYHERYRYPYPWTKYTQVFVPEYNIGAMENPGCITFNENYIPRGGWSINERHSLANTIAHEMCHMWFGDLVTPIWWDDLWLKESFADYEAYGALAKATEFTDSWAVFALGRKAGAYRADLAPTTHPIAADIPDSAAATQNFDGITYCKGAATLKQLAAWVGEDAFVAGMREYFRDHEYGAAKMSDLLTALQRHADLTGWVQPWLEVAGPSIIHVGETLTIESRDPRTGEEIYRPHCIAVSQRETTPGGSEWVTQVTRDANGMSIDPRNTIVNDRDLTYAVVDYSDWSIPRELLDDTDVLRQALGWSALQLGVWRGTFAPQEFVDAALARIAQLPPAFGFVVANVCADFLNGWGAHISAEQLASLHEQHEFFLAREDNERYKRFGVLLPAASVNVGNGQEAARRLSTTRVVEQSWQLASAAVATGALSAVDAISLVDDESTRGANLALRVQACAPGVAAQWRDRVIHEDWTNQAQVEILAGLALNRDQADWDAQTYLREIGSAWQAKPLHMSQNLARVLLPLDSSQWDTLRNATVPAAWHRAILDGLDLSGRKLFAREHF